MVTIDVWRARIGFHSARLAGSDVVTVSLHLSSVLLQIFHFVICLILLIIGNVEVNPGPASQFCCAYGQFAATFASLSEHAKHQRIYANNCNSTFECRVCMVQFSS